MLNISGAAGCFFLLGLLLCLNALALLFGGSGCCLFGLALGVGFGLDLLALCLFGVTAGLFFAFLGLLLPTLGGGSFLQLAVGFLLAGLPWRAGVAQSLPSARLNGAPTGMGGTPCATSCAPVRMARTPGRACAALVSIDTMRACG